MTMKRGLGKGLDALFETYKEDENSLKTEEHSTIQDIRIMDIDPNPLQPRKYFKDDKITELAESIRIHGVVQPVIVRQKDSRYFLVAGERRWRAARLAGLSLIPAVIMDLDDRQVMEIGLIENLQREDLNPIEEANGIKQLLEEYKLTQEEIATHLGRSRPAVANSLRLLNLSSRIQQMLMEDKLTSGHARCLLAIEDEGLREKLIDVIVEKGLSVRDTEKLVKSYSTNHNRKNIRIDKPSYISELETGLEDILGTRVEITPGRKKGVIQIEYYSNEDLERIIERVSTK